MFKTLSFPNPALGIELPPQTRVREVWYEGDIDLLRRPLASIIGTREVSIEGATRARKIAALLVGEGFCVVSGMAKGIDAIGHYTALELGGKTIAVMGTPIDQCYPSEHLELKNRIMDQGLVISQFAPEERVHKSNFPRRNILMAALSSITFVIEASASSGTRHQVKAAIEMGKRVAFLASLAEKRFPWVEDALDSDLGFIVQHPSDVLKLLEGLSIERSNKVDEVKRLVHESLESTAQTEFFRILSQDENETKVRSQPEQEQNQPGRAERSSSKRSKVARTQSAGDTPPLRFADNEEGETEKSTESSPVGEKGQLDVERDPAPAEAPSEVEKPVELPLNKMDFPEEPVLANRVENAARTQVRPCGIEKAPPVDILPFEETPPKGKKPGFFVSLWRSIFGA